MQIGFVGLGKMGSGIAKNLLRAGHDVIVYNRSREKAESFAAQGVEIANSPAEACRGRQAVMTMLADDAALDQIVFEKDGIAGALERGSVHVSHSTISTRFAKRLTGEHASRGQEFVSAPVFGRPDAAENKKLIVLAAGHNEALERCRPLFDAIGRATFVAGLEPWHANAMKLCGNFMIASMLETFSEAFATLRKSGIDHHRFLDVMNELFASPVYQNYGRTIAEEQFTPAGFTLKLGLKDVRQVLETADDANAAMPLASLIRDRMLSGMANGQEDLDWSSIAQVSARSTGLDPSC